MDLKNIRNPQFLKALNEKQLEALAQSIREFLIHQIAETGGHLSSNLGIVELTIALHKVFDSPSDKLVFDVGHQTYVHKILTGRADQFESLRQHQGLSGFQKRSESSHDVWEAGHASTALSAALAFAVTRDLNQKDYHVVAIIGDGAFGGGMTLEAINHLASLNKRLILILNDNNMSISATSGPISKLFDTLRTSDSYVSVKSDLKKSLSHLKQGDRVIKSLSNIKGVVKKTVIKQSYLSELGVDYFGPIDGHNFKELLHVLEAVRHKDGPVIVHVQTKKGKGYHPTESDFNGSWHGVSSFDVDTGRPKAKVPDNYLNWSSCVANTVLELAESDQRIVAITPAMTIGSGLEEFRNKYPDRFFDTGITEEHAATFAAGLALSGKRPFLALYSTFLQRAYDQINHDITRLNVPVLIGVDRSGIVGEDGDTHQGVFDVGILRPLPNIIIAQGKDYQETRNLIYTALHLDGPFALRYPRGSTLIGANAAFEMIEVGSWDNLNQIKQPKAIIIGYGPQIEKVLQKVLVNDLPYLVVNARFIKPLDKVLLKTLVNYQVPIFTYEEEMLSGGLSSAILEYFNDEKLTAQLIRVGIKDQYVEHGSIAELKKALAIDLNSFFSLINDYIMEE